MIINLEPSHSPAKMKAVATTTVAEERFSDHGQDWSPTAPTFSSGRIYHYLFIVAVKVCGT